jgi:NOL1/NOP2/sun family putative RNA methylase
MSDDKADSNVSNKEELNVLIKIQHKLVPIRVPYEIKFKPGFIERYSALTDWETFKSYSTSYLNRSLRVNTLKITIPEIKERLAKQGWMLEQVPWCKQGFWAEHNEGRLDLGNTLEHQLGYFYIQEAASMIPPIALDPKPGEIVLDMCAAPGSKTTQIAEMMKNSGVLIANDVSGIRLAPLGVNVQRLGITCVVQTLRDSARLQFPFKFDKILLDAPCSGVGTIRKSLKTIDIWSNKMGSSLSQLQRKLLHVAWPLLRPGGVLIYSTCSTEPEEDEEVVSDFVLKHEDAKIVDIDLPGFKRSKPLLEFQGKTYHPDIAKTLRVWPQDNDTEGFYVAKLKKAE